MSTPLAALALLLLAPLTVAPGQDAGSIDAIARSRLATGKAPGFCLAVQKDGKPLFVQGYGVADPDSRKPVTPATRFAMGSVSKQFAADASLAGHRELWHHGLTPTAGGYNLNGLFPDERLAIVVLSNGPDFAPEPEKLVRAIAEKLLPGPAGRQAAPASSPTPAASAAPMVEDHTVTATALKIYGQMRAGKVDTALLTPEMAAAATPDILAGMKPMFDTLGDPKQLKLESVEKLAKGTSYLYLAIFPTAQFHISLFITHDGKVGGYRLKP